MPFKKTRTTPSHGTPAASDDITGGIGWSGLAELQRFVEAGGLFITLGSGSMLPLEGGIVRGVRRESGGVPRRLTGRRSGCRSCRAAGEHSHARCAPPGFLCAAGSPDRYGYPERTHVFRQNYPLYAVPRRWLRMAYCTSCLDGPIDPSGVVLEWGDRDGKPVRRERAGVGRTEPDWTPRHSGSALGSGPRGRVQLQPAASRFSIGAISGCCGTRSSIGARSLRTEVTLRDHSTLRSLQAIDHDRSVLLSARLAEQTSATRTAACHADHRLGRPRPSASQPA